MNGWQKIYMRMLQKKNLKSLFYKKKECVNPAAFYYDAGQAARLVLIEAEEAGSDGLTASCGGITEFMNFIGVKYDDENDNIKLTKEEFHNNYCQLCGSQRCEGIDTEWFDGCKYKDHLLK